MKTQYIISLAGTAFFAISAAILAIKRSKHDWFGVTFISFITAIGGGTVRDILLDSYPLVWVKDVNYMYAIIAGVIITAIFYERIIKFRKIMFVLDTLGVAIFTIIGTEKAIHFGLSPLIAAIMGMFTAVMGGVIRDVLTRETPILFRKELYASVCLAGALFYIGLEKAGCNRSLSVVLAIVLILVIRIIAVKWKLSFPNLRRLELD